MTTLNFAEQMAQVETMDRLAEVAASLPKRDNIFAGKMLVQFDRYGSLSSKQMQIVEDILARNGF